jgi:hypothetical protein
MVGCSVFREPLSRAALVTAASALALAGCSPKSPPHEDRWVGVTPSIAYADPFEPGLMWFIDETTGFVLFGNRNPDQWTLAGPPSPYRLQKCDAGPNKCIVGFADLAPIIVGDMSDGKVQLFPKLGVAVVRRVKLPCDTFETTPLQSVAPKWSQKVTRCGNIGVVQIDRRDEGRKATVFNLKSAVGLFGTGLVSVPLRN